MMDGEKVYLGDGRELDVDLDIGRVSMDVDLVDERWGTFVLTAEGLIIDIFDSDGGLLGTFARTYEEFHDQIAPR